MAIVSRSPICERSEQVGGVVATAPHLCCTLSSHHPSTSPPFWSACRHHITAFLSASADNLPRCSRAWPSTFHPPHSPLASLVARDSCAWLTSRSSTLECRTISKKSTLPISPSLLPTSSTMFESINDPESEPWAAIPPTTLPLSTSPTTPTLMPILT